MSTRPTNLSMSMQLSFTDAYSILHASTWGKADQESAFIKSERIEVPLEDDLSRTESCKYERLDLGPNVGFLPDRKTKIMVREDYHAIWKCVEDDRSTPGREFGGTVLTGHPGIGKGLSLYYYLVKNLLSAEPTAFQTDKSSFFVFVETGVFLIRFTPNTAIYDIQSHLKQLGCTAGMLALVDSSDKSPSPAPVFTDDRFPFYVVQATSPVPSRWKEWSERRSASIVVMKPWSWSEIYIGGSTFANRSMSAEDLSHIYRKYGPTPQVCFDIAGDERRIRKHDWEFQRQLRKSPFFLNEVEEHGLTDNFAASFSSTLMMGPDAERLPFLTFISPEVPGRMGPDDVRRIFKLLDSEVATREEAQLMWKVVMLQRMFAGRMSFCFNCVNLSTTPAAMKQPYFILQSSSSPEHISVTDIPEIRLQTAYIFEAKTFRSYDAILVTYYENSWNGAHYTLHLFKVVTELNSEIHLEELDKLADNLPEWRPWDVQPEVTNFPWKLIFVVPPRRKDNFKAQPYRGIGAHEWEAKGFISQYVVGAEL